LADTRPDFQVGPRSTPIAADEAYTLSGWGAVGECTLPNSTTALSLNVTAVDATLPTFLTLFPADSTRPNASHLNPTPGQPPTPNAVNVDLDTSGEFSVFNRFGTVDVIIDVVGYYDDHVHKSADIVDEPGVSFNYSRPDVLATSTPSRMVLTSLRVPADGYVAIEVSGNWWGNDTVGLDVAICQLQKGAIGAIDFDEPWFYLDSRDDNSARKSGFSAHRVMPIATADNPPIEGGQALSLVCDEFFGDIRLSNLHISATFYATSYQPPSMI